PPSPAPRPPPKSSQPRKPPRCARPPRSCAFESPPDQGPPVLEYNVTARRIDSHGSVANTKDAEIALDTDVAGRTDRFNPAELFLAATSACMIKGIERVMPMIRFERRGVEVKLHAVRQDAPPKLISVDYDLIVDADET